MMHFHQGHLNLISSHHTKLDGPKMAMVLTHVLLSNESFIKCEKEKGKDLYVFCSIEETPRLEEMFVYASS